jgi:hypothetical protein
MLHRLLYPDADRVDHINGDGLDNRRANTRACTHAQNNMNKGIGKNNTSGYKGVIWNARLNKWVAQIGYKYRGYNLGLFVCKHDAAAAYNKAATEFFGEFAKLNTIKVDDV